MSRPTLFGRDRELALLGDCLSAARDGQGRLVLINGEAGIGKTALTDHLAQIAADGGATVLVGHGFDRTEMPPFSPWVEIAQRVAALSGRANPLPAFQPERATSQGDVFAQAHALLVALTATQPIILVLEDLHWADRASLDLLRFVACGVEPLPLLLVGTYRAEEIDRRHPLTELIPRLVRVAPTVRLNLRPLDVTAVQALLRARLHLQDAGYRRLAEYLVERTAGNSLFLTELLRHLEEENLLDLVAAGGNPESVGQRPVPALLRHIVDERLSRLGDEPAALLAVAAVIGQEAPLAVWQAVTAKDDETLLTVAERAEAAHLVAASPRADGIRFAHALIRDVLYDHVAALRRRRLHQRVAEALIVLPAPDPDAVASHFQHAGDERGAPWLVRAAERAEDAYALVIAADRYEAAMTLLDTQSTDLAERGWVRLLAAALRRNDDRDRALAWVEEVVKLAAQAGDASLGARAQALRGLLIAYGGDFAQAAAAMSTAADLVDSLPPGTGVTRRREEQIDKIANRGTLIAILARGGRLAEARERGEAYLASVSDPAAMPGGLGAIADAQSGLAMAYALQGEPALARRSYAAAIAAYQASDLHLFTLMRQREELILTVLPFHADELAERERVAAAAERTAVWISERGGHVNADLPRYARAPLLVLEGEWQEARAILEPPDTWDLVFTSAVRAYYLGLIARAQGKLDDAWQCVLASARIRPDVEPGERVANYLVQEMQRLAVGLALDASNLPLARRWLDLHHRWSDFMGATAGRAEGEVAEAEWHRAAGDTERARAHAEQALVDATTPRQPLALLAAHRMLGDLATDAGAFEVADAHLAESLVLADACRAPYERSQIMLTWAELALAKGDAVAAATALDDVRAVCTSLGAFPTLARVEQLADLLAQRDQSRAAQRPPVAGLTPRELDVLRLVAAGMSNGEIAEQLYLSRNTVKVHVANILAKIGVHNRAAATEFALRNGIA
jgi:DNA-binding CsgD family transcriptional regulator